MRVPICAAAAFPPKSIDETNPIVLSANLHKPSPYIAAQRQRVIAMSPAQSCWQ
jgi:hypothetical protein